MKPKPLSSLNHFTVPVAMYDPPLSLLLAAYAEVLVKRQPTGASSAFSPDRSPAVTQQRLNQIDPRVYASFPAAVSRIFGAWNRSLAAGYQAGRDGYHRGHRHARPPGSNPANARAFGGAPGAPSDRRGGQRVIRRNAGCSAPPA